MHPLKSFENLQTRNPIRILQVYLAGDIIFKMSLFLWSQSESVCLMFLLYDKSSLSSSLQRYSLAGQKTQAEEANCVDLSLRSYHMSEIAGMVTYILLHSSTYLLYQHIPPVAGDDAGWSQVFLSSHTRPVYILSRNITNTYIVSYRTSCYIF